MRKLFIVLIGSMCLMSSCAYYSNEPNSIIGKWNVRYDGRTADEYTDFVLSFDKDGYFHSRITTENFEADVYSKYTFVHDTLVLYDTWTYDEYSKKNIYFNDNQKYYAHVDGDQLYWEYSNGVGVYYRRK